MKGFELATIHTSPEEKELRSAVKNSQQKATECKAAYNNNPTLLTYKEKILAEISTYKAEIELWKFKRRSKLNLPQVIQRINSQIGELENKQKQAILSGYQEIEKSWKIFVRSKIDVDTMQATHNISVPEMLANPHEKELIIENLTTELDNLKFAFDKFEECCNNLNFPDQTKNISIDYSGIEVEELENSGLVAEFFRLTKIESNATLTFGKNTDNQKWIREWVGRTDQNKLTNDEMRLKSIVLQILSKEKEEILKAFGFVKGENLYKIAKENDSSAVRMIFHAILSDENNSHYNEMDGQEIIFHHSQTKINIKLDIAKNNPVLRGIIESERPGLMPKFFTIFDNISDTVLNILNTASLECCGNKNVTKLATTLQEYLNQYLTAESGNIDEKFWQSVNETLNGFKTTLAESFKSPPVNNLIDGLIGELKKLKSLYVGVGEIKDCVTQLKSVLTDSNALSSAVKSKSEAVILAIITARTQGINQELLTEQVFDAFASSSTESKDRPLEGNLQFLTLLTEDQNNLEEQRKSAIELIIAQATEAVNPALKAKRKDWQQEQFTISGECAQKSQQVLEQVQKINVLKTALASRNNFFMGQQDLATISSSDANLSSQTTALVQAYDNVYHPNSADDTTTNQPPLPDSLTKFIADIEQENLSADHKLLVVETKLVEKEVGNQDFLKSLQSKLPLENVAAKFQEAEIDLSDIERRIDALKIGTEKFVSEFDQTKLKLFLNLIQEGEDVEKASQLVYGQDYNQSSLRVEFKSLSTEFVEQLSGADCQNAAKQLLTIIENPTSKPSTTVSGGSNRDNENLLQKTQEQSGIATGHSVN